MSAPDMDRTNIEEALHSITGVAELLDLAQEASLKTPLTSAAINLLLSTLEGAVKQIKGEVWPEQGGVP